jgi:hypothetical protein
MFNLRVDKAFMKYSVEARLPLQDPALASTYQRIQDKAL